MLARLAALLVLGLGGLAVVLPRADAHDASRVAVSDLGQGRSLLLSAEPMSGGHFSVFYAIAHR